MEATIILAITRINNTDMSLFCMAKLAAGTPPSYDATQAEI